MTVALFVLLTMVVLVWPVLQRHRQQQQRFAAAVDAVNRVPPRRSPPRVTKLAPAGLDASNQAQAQGKLEEAGLELIALLGRLEATLNASDEDGGIAALARVYAGFGAADARSRVHAWSDELIAAGTALANIDATLRDAAALAGVNHPFPRCEGPSHELPTSISFDFGLANPTETAGEEALYQLQRKAALAKLRVAQARARQLEQVREQLSIQARTAIAPESSTDR